MGMEEEGLPEDLMGSLLGVSGGFIRHLVFYWGKVEVTKREKPFSFRGALSAKELRTWGSGKWWAFNSSVGNLKVNGSINKQGIAIGPFTRVLQLQ
ncbi:hypothetical protein ACH5RR_004762 [Cinchona calisaya]|uniref:Uncharacterized protein n=1 Tax=Cinchona calisaya TaxID=153742 RepID=A0ABD3AYY2_9GENT